MIAKRVLKLSKGQVHADPVTTVEIREYYTTIYPVCKRRRDDVEIWSNFDVNMRSVFGHFVNNFSTSRYYVEQTSILRLN